MEPKGKVDPESYRLELPFDVKSVHPLNREQYLIEMDNTGQNTQSIDALSRVPDSGNIFMLKKESSDDDIPTLLSPISQRAVRMDWDNAAGVEYLDKNTSNLLEIRYRTCDNYIYVTQIHYVIITN